MVLQTRSHRENKRKRYYERRHLYSILFFMESNFFFEQEKTAKELLKFWVFELKKFEH